MVLMQPSLGNAAGKPIISCGSSHAKPLHPDQTSGVQKLAGQSRSVVALPLRPTAHDVKAKTSVSPRNRFPIPIFIINLNS